MKRILLSGILGLALNLTSTAQSLEWALGIPGQGNDLMSVMALDTFGNVYISGIFTGTADFDPGVGTTSYTANAFGEIFLAKFDQDGDFIWAKHFDGTSNASIGGIVTDDTSNIFLTGQFYETVDFDPNGGTANLTAPVSNDIFLAKIDSAGNYKWAKHIGSTGQDAGNAIALDEFGNIFVTGNFEGTVDFDPDLVDVVNLVSGGYDDVFITKFNAAGYLQWAKKLGGAGLDYSYAIALDGSGNIYTTGWFTNTLDVDPSGAFANLVATGTSWNCFISKLDNNGNYLWGKQVSGTNFVGGESIKTDASDNVFIGGQYMETADFDPGAVTLNKTSNGIEDIFITKLTSAGDLIWNKSFGGTGTDKNWAMAVDASGSVVTSGTFQSTVDFDPGVGISNFTSDFSLSTTYADAYVTHMDANGNYIWTKQIGGYVDDYASAVAIDPDGFVYSTGLFFGPVDFDPDGGTNMITSTAGTSDLYIQKLNICSVNTGVTQTGGTLTANAASGTYAWVDCNIFAQIGVTTQSHTPIADGNFAVIITQGACKDTSTCYAVTGVGMNELANSIFTVYPNPTNSNLTISTADAINVVRVYNSAGILIQTEIKNTFSVEQLPAGIYFVEIQTNNGVGTVRFVKE